MLGKDIPISAVVEKNILDMEFLAFMKTKHSVLHFTFDYFQCCVFYHYSQQVMASSKKKNHDKEVAVGGERWGVRESTTTTNRKR